MSKNCYNKTLIGSINNNELPRVNEVALHIETTAASNAIISNGPASGTIFVYFENKDVVRLINAVFSDNTSEKLFNYEAVSLNITSARKGIIVFIPMIVRQILCVNNIKFEELDLYDLKYTNLTSFAAAGNVFGDIANLPNNQFTSLSFNAVSEPSKIVGDLAELCARIKNANGTSSIGNYGNIYFAGTNIVGDLSLVPKDMYNFITGTNSPDGRVFHTWTQGQRANSDCYILGCGADSYYGFKTVTDAENFLIDNASCSYGSRNGARNMIIYTENGESYTPSSDVTTAVAALKTKGMQTISINNTVL